MYHFIGEPDSLNTLIFFFTFLEENIESTPLTTQLSDDEENISNELLEVVVENPDDKV